MNQKVYFPNLDGLRFFAFFFVFMFHCYYQIPEQGKDSSLYLAFHKLWENGDLGVNFFFTLSGFLITYLLLSEERQQGNFQISGFYWRRVLRIWPLYYFTLIFGYFIFQKLIQAVGAEVEETADIWYYVFFIGNFNSIINGAPVSSTLSVLWSLAIEEQFYLFWPILLLIFKRNRTLLFSILLFASLAFRFLYVNHNDVLFYHTLSVMSDLVVGSWMGWWCLNKTFKPADEASISKKWSIIIYILGFILILFRKEIFVEPAMLIIERFVFSLFFAYIIYEQTFFRWSIFKTKNFGRVSYWGKFTYGLYCLHIPAMVFTEGFAMIGGAHEAAWWVFFGKTISTFILSLIFARLSYKYIESPFLRLKDTPVGHVIPQKVK